MTASGAAFDLTGASVEVLAKKHGMETVALSASITDAPGGIITVTVTSDQLDNGVYTLQVRVTKAGQIQTVTEALIAVKLSLRAPE